MVERLDMNSRRKPAGLSVESWARQLRYEFFYREAGKRGCLLATAHTASDRRETVLFNITRGSSIKGAAGIPAVRERIIRPLIDCSREEIEEYCRVNGLEYVTDRTNFETIYSRNKIRLEVLPVLRQINSRAEESIVDFARDAEEIYTFLSQLSDNLLKEASVEGGLDARKLLDAPGAVTKNLIRDRLDVLGCLSRDNVETVYALLEKDKGRHQLTEGLFARVEGGVLSFGAVPEKIRETEVAAVIGEELSFLGKRFFIEEVEEVSALLERPKKYLTDCVDYDRIADGPVLRNRRRHDSITLARRKVTKTVKKLLIEDRVSARERDTLAVLSDRTGRLIWLEGYGTSAPFGVTPSTKRAVRIRKL